MNYKFIILSPLLMAQILFGQNNTFFNSVNSHLNQYKKNISKNDLKINFDEIHLTLRGRRTNHKSLLLIGFNALGKQLQKSPKYARTVKVSILYEMKNTQVSTFTAPTELVIKLSKGALNPRQFLTKIQQ